MGNIEKNTIEEAVNSKINLKLKKRGLENISPGCKKCEIVSLCNSGCMHSAYLSGNIYGKDPYCLSYKTLYSKMNLEIKPFSSFSHGFMFTLET